MLESVVEKNKVSEGNETSERKERVFVPLHFTLPFSLLFYLNINEPCVILPYVRFIKI